MEPAAPRASPSRLAGPASPGRSAGPAGPSRLAGPAWTAWPGEHSMSGPSRLASSTSPGSRQWPSRLLVHTGFPAPRGCVLCARPPACPVSLGTGHQGIEGNKVAMQGTRVARAHPSHCARALFRLFLRHGTPLDSFRQYGTRVLFSNDCDSESVVSNAPDSPPSTAEFLVRSGPAVEASNHRGASRGHVAQQRARPARRSASHRACAARTRQAPTRPSALCCRRRHRGSNRQPEAA
jgi:hypothetical protein